MGQIISGKPPPQRRAAELVAQRAATEKAPPGSGAKFSVSDLPKCE